MAESWLTYAEAAVLLQIKQDSVKRRARARRWPRRIGNDSMVRVCIPDDVLTGIREDDPRPKNPHHPPADDAFEALRRAETEAATYKARAEALADQVEDLRADRQRLLSIIERDMSRVVDPKPAIGFFDRFFRRG